MLFKLPLSLALVAIGLKGASAACSFQKTTCRMSASITQTAAGTSLNDGRGLYLVSDLGKFTASPNHRRASSWIHLG